MPADKLRPDDFQNIEEALLMQDAINVVSTFWVLCLNLQGLRIFGLQFVSPQSHAANNIRPLLGQLFLSVIPKLLMLGWCIDPIDEKLVQVWWGKKIC